MSERKVARACCALTRKGRPCPINADRIEDGQWYCHVHDPWGQYRSSLRLDGKTPKPVVTRQDLRAEDPALELFEAPTPEQLKVVKRRLSAWRRRGETAVS